MSEKYKTLTFQYYSIRGEKTLIQAGDIIKCHGHNTYSITRNGESIRLCTGPRENPDNKMIIEDIVSFLTYTSAAVGLKVSICDTSPSKWQFHD